MEKNNTQTKTNYTSNNNHHHHRRRFCAVHNQQSRLEPTTTIHTATKKKTQKEKPKENQLVSWHCVHVSVYFHSPFFNLSSTSFFTSYFFLYRVYTTTTTPLAKK